jgi:hypothetical protein
MLSHMISVIIIELLGRFMALLPQNPPCIYQSKQMYKTFRQYDL